MNCAEHYENLNFVKVMPLFHFPDTLYDHCCRMDLHTKLIATVEMHARVAQNAQVEPCNWRLEIAVQGRCIYYSFSRT